MPFIDICFKCWSALTLCPPDLTSSSWFAILLLKLNIVILGLEGLAIGLRHLEFARR